jgi:truncated hemoglobin YjbI
MSTTKNAPRRDHDTAANAARRRNDDLKPDDEMWSALEHGEKLTRILDDFYGRVYQDPRLAPFFHGVTRERAIEKQYSFLRQIFTGEPIYFGDRPRNAHHWMVISNELFDYREALMEECLRRACLPEPLVQRWRAIEERFRKQIVKSAPFGKKLRGVTLPLEGYESLELAVGACCDGCSEAIEAGARASYHVRTGRTYCAACFQPAHELQTQSALQSQSELPTEGDA